MLPCSRRSFQQSREKKIGSLKQIVFPFRGPYWPSWIRIPIAASSHSSVVDLVSLNPDSNPAFLVPSTVPYLYLFPLYCCEFCLASRNDSYEAPESLSPPSAPPSSPPAPFLLLHSWAKFIYLIKSLGVVFSFYLISSLH
jgi:hypothetical protein